MQFHCLVESPHINYGQIKVLLSLAHSLYDLEGCSPYKRLRFSSLERVVFHMYSVAKKKSTTII